MLTVYLSATDDSDAVELTFEHSLISLSKWESITKKAFYGKQEKTSEEAALYIKSMLLTENAPDEFLNRLSPDNITTITDYINDPQTATWFQDSQQQKSTKEIVTSELIYYWLVQFTIPFQPVETWHLNRLMTLVKICGIKQTKPKPMSKGQQAEHYRKLNAERRAATGSTG